MAEENGGAQQQGNGGAGSEGASQAAAGGTQASSAGQASANANGSSAGAAAANPPSASSGGQEPSGAKVESFSANYVGELRSEAAANRVAATTAKEQIKAETAARKAAEERVQALTIANAISSVASKLNVDAKLTGKLLDVKSLEFSEDGSIKDIEGAIKKLGEEFPNIYGQGAVAHANAQRSNLTLDQQIDQMFAKTGRKSADRL